MSATTFYATNYRRVQHKCVSVVCLLWYILTQSVCVCVYQSEGKRAVNHILSSMATIATRLTELLVSAVECAE